MVGQVKRPLLALLTCTKSLPLPWPNSSCNPTCTSKDGPFQRIYRSCRDKDPQITISPWAHGTAGFSAKLRPMWGMCFLEATLNPVHTRGAAHRNLTRTQEEGLPPRCEEMEAPL